MSTTISKDELRRPDHMTEVGQRFFLKLLQRQKVVLGVIIGLVVTGAAVVAWNKLALNRELTVQEQFYVVEKAYLKKKEAFEKAEVEAKDAAAKNDKKVSSVSGLPTGDFSKDYGTELQGWFQLIEANPSSKAAAMAALELSQLHLKYNQPKEAQSLLAKVKDHQNSDDLLGAMVFHSYATVLANQGQCQESVGIWETLEKKKKMSFLAEQAQLSRALCLETLGQVEKAEAVLGDLVAGKTTSEKQVQVKPKTQIQRTAENYLRYLKLKKNVGETKT